MEAFRPCYIPGALGAGFGREGPQPPFMEGETEALRMSTTGARSQPWDLSQLLLSCPGCSLRGHLGSCLLGIYSVPDCWGGCLTGDRKHAHLPISEHVPGQFSIQPVPGLPGPWTRYIGPGDVRGQTLCLEVRVPFWCCHFPAV